jgi:xylulokinase
MSPRPRALLGVDLGSSALRCGYVTLDGRLLGLAREPLSMSLDPATGRVEQDQDDWWRALRSATRALASRIDADVAGIAIDGHGPTVVPVDNEGRPAGPSIAWLDHRAGAEAKELAAATGLTGWDLGIVPSALWLERHAPAIVDRAAWYLNTWDALTFRLTGRARTSLLAGQSWPDLDRLAGFGSLRHRLPDRIDAGSVVGPLLPEVAAELGLQAGTPVVAGMVDAFATFHGAGMVGPGDAVDVGGSAGGFGVYWDRPIRVDGSFTNVAPLPGLYSIGGAMAALGTSLDWLRDVVFAGGLDADQVIDLAAGSPPGADGVVFLPYLAGERAPIWDPDARGAFVGLRLVHGRPHLARAVLEASAFAVRQVIEPIRAAGVDVGAMRVAGGQARSPAWNQIKADITGLAVEVPRVADTAVVGSAILAATGVGAHPDLLTAIRAMTAIERRVEPRLEHAATYDHAFAKYVALHPALAPIIRGAPTPPAGVAA